MKKKAASVRDERATAEKRKEVVEESRRNYEEAHKRLGALDSREKVESRNMAQVKKKIEDLETKGVELSALSKKEERYIALKKEMESMEETRALWERANSLEEERKRVGTEVEKAKEALEKLTDVPRELEVGESRLEESEKKDAEVEKHIKGLSSKKSRLEQRRETLLSAAEEAEEHLEQLSTLGEDGVCPTCERPLGEHYSILTKKYETESEQRKERIAGLEEELKGSANEEAVQEKLREAIRKKIKRLRGELKKLAEDAREAQMLAKRISMGEERLLGLKEERKALKGTDYDPLRHAERKKETRGLEATHTRYIRIKESVEALPDILKERKELEASLASAKKERKEIGILLREIKFDPEEYAALENGMKTLLGEERELAHRLSEAKAEEAGIVSSLRSFCKREEELRRAEEKMTEWKEEISYLHRLAGARASDPAVFNHFLVA
ncbi:MAG: hypothetical protein KAT70_04670, partial [Thermoplasmata archaeon]|nr:hypothetical protein [Thermoplasmata archaeon]